jgi:hypothetical protein
MRKILTSSPPRAWKELYMTALFENDRERLPGLISQARRAAMVRSRELFLAHQADARAERQALDNALYFWSLLEKLALRKERLAA